MKTNYLNHYSLRLLVGHLLLTMPSLCAVVIGAVWNIDFLMLPPVLGIIGWVLVLPVTYTIARNSKERVAIDALSGGLLMLCLCSATVSIKYTCLKEFLRFQAPGEIKEEFDPRERDSKGKHSEPRE